MAARQNNGNIRQYRKPFNINLGTFIFFLIFVYIIICVGIYLFRDQKVVAYRVQEGALSVDNIYTAIALRDETVVTSSYNGYINYYAREGERVGANQLVCTVDESGQIKEILDEQNADNTSLSGSDMRELRTSISGFCANFSPHEFNSVYNFKYELEGTVLNSLTLTYWKISRSSTMQRVRNRSISVMRRNPALLPIRSTVMKTKHPPI